MKSAIGRVVLLASAAISCLAEAQAPPNCPVEIKNSGTGPTFNQPYPRGFSVNFVNQASSKLIGVKFSLEFMDAVGDFHAYIFPLTASVGEKPGKGTSVGGALNEAAAPQSYRGYRVTLEKAAFEDGTTWQDDGRKSCALAVDYKAKK